MSDNIDDIMEDLIIGHNFEYAGKQLKLLLANKIKEAELRARIDELESFTGHSNEIPDSEVRARIATLRKELDGGSDE